MPHPDARIVDVPLRIDQVLALIELIEGTVAGGTAHAPIYAGPVLSLYGALPADESYMRPGTQHWALQR